MAEASSDQSVHVHKDSNPTKNKGKDVMTLDTTVNSTDLYRMCKKIAQLTKVIYNLNVKNDELEIFQSRMQHDYEKKVWKLTADVQQHVSNTASLMRTESTRSSELSQLRTHLGEQMALSNSLSEELSCARQRHADELSAVADESERRLAAQQAALRAAETEQQAQSERLAETETELAAERVARLRSDQEANGLHIRVCQLEQELQEEQDRAQTWRAESERAAADSERRAEAELALRRELASQQRQTGELRSQLDESCSREQLLGCQVSEQRAERERLTEQLAASTAELRDRDAQLLERDCRLQEQAGRLATLSEHLQSRCEQLHSQQAQLESSRQQLERLSVRLQTVQAESGAARSRADQLSQLLMARDATVSCLESELAEAKIEAAGARTRAENAETEADAAKVKADVAEAKVQTAEANAEAAKQNVGAAEAKAKIAEAMYEAAEARAEAAELKAEAAERNAAAAETKAETAESTSEATKEKARVAEEKARMAEAEAEAAEARTRIAEEKTEVAEARAETAEAKAKVAEEKVADAKAQAAEATSKVNKTRVEAAEAEATSEAEADGNAAAVESAAAVQAELAEARERLVQMEGERDAARQQLQESEDQREEQAELMQAALQESAALDSECRRRVEALQTVIAEREQQLMDDAETRLREVRRECKRKLEQQQKVAEERLGALRQTLEADLLSQRQTLEERSANLDGRVTETEALRSFEAEVVQLRGLTHELMRELRVGTHQVELCRAQEARTAEENRRLSELINKHNSAVANIQKEQQQTRLQLEQQWRLQAEQELSALDAQWEDRLREERRTLKVELDSLHSEEKHLAVESMRLGREQRLQEAEQCVRQLQRQLECAGEEIRQLRNHHQMELEQREREAEAIIADLHRQLQTVQTAPTPEKLTGLPVTNGGVSDPGRPPVLSGSVDGSPDVSDPEDGGGDARSTLERALLGRPRLQAALDSLLTERDRQAALLQQQLTADTEHCDHERAGQLQEQLAAAESQAQQLQQQLAELRQDHDRLSQLLADGNRGQLSAASKAVSEAETETDRPRPEDVATICRLQQALQHSEQQVDQLRREKQQLGLELANRDASYSRLFAGGAARVGLIRPTGTPPQRRPAGRR